MSSLINLNEFMDLVEVTLIRRALKTCDYNRTKAAKMLGMERTTLQGIMKDFCKPGYELKEPPLHLGECEEYASVVNELSQFFRDTEIVYLKSKALELLR